MKLYETHEAARIVDLPEDRILSCVRAGFLKPERGPGREYRFSFQDLLLLKTTKGLLDSGVPATRVARLMGSLRRQLPDERQLARVRIYADGRRVVVWDGATRWEPDSGQFLFDFDAASVAGEAGEPPAAPRAGRGRIVALAGPAGSAPRGAAPRPPAERAPAGRSAEASLTAEEWYDLACELEGESRDEARHAYQRVLALDPTHADAHVNLGRQYHEIGDHERAETHYRAAARHASGDPVVWFNLGVLEEDRGRAEEAVRCYRRAIEKDADYADAHYNLGLLLDSLGRRPEAFPHLLKARRLLERA